MKLSKNGLERVEHSVARSFSKVRDELDEHLDGINKNFSEIQSLYEYIAHLEQKIEKLTEIATEQSETRSQEYSISPLTYREQEVFLVIYASDLPISREEVSRKLGLTVDVIHHYVRRLSEKGVPLLEQIRTDGNFSYSMDLQFKDTQARKGIVPIRQEILQEIRDEKLD